MKPTWICGCKVTHYLELSERDGYICRFCGHEYGQEPPAKLEVATEAATVSDIVAPPAEKTGSAEEIAQ